MFRPMRRSKQQLSEAEMLKILQNGKTGILGVMGDDGYPYTVPINYVFADGKIYYHGAKSGHKQDAILNCDKVSLCVIERDTVVPEELTTHFRSVILFGRARKLETDAEIAHAAHVLGMKYYPNAERVDAEIRDERSTLSCVEIIIEHITGKEAMELTRNRK